LIDATVLSGFAVKAELRIHINQLKLNHQEVSSFPRFAEGMCPVYSSIPYPDSPFDWPLVVNQIDPPQDWMAIMT
jgi:hypothetical protein